VYSESTAEPDDFAAAFYTTQSLISLENTAEAHNYINNFLTGNLSTRLIIMSYRHKCQINTHSTTS